MEVHGWLGNKVEKKNKHLRSQHYSLRIVVIRCVTVMIRCIPRTCWRMFSVLYRNSHNLTIISVLNNMATDTKLLYY
jgi:hypothetical protein